MRGGKISLCFAMLLVLRALGAGAQAQAPRAAPPTPPAGDAQKPAGDALAQEAEAKPKEPEDEKDNKKKEPRLQGHFAAGLTFTSGNSQTRSLNLALSLEYKLGAKDLLKADAFYLQNREDGVSSVDRTSAHLRDERSLNERWFAFADLQYLKDRFKAIDSLVAPTVGAGVHLIKDDKQELSADLGAGAVFERDEGLGRTTSGVVRAGESYLWKISKSANLTESAFALWKTRDFSDAYYHFEVALGAAVNDHLELKVALLDEYKAKPVDPTIQSNDVAGIVSIGYKL